VKRLSIIVAALVLAGCGWHGSGTVSQKDHDSAWVQITTTCHTYGKTTSCAPGTIYHPENWELRIRDAKGDKHWVDVTEAEYSAAKIGDAFSNGEAK
jgi:hypothetical protein